MIRLKVKKYLQFHDEIYFASVLVGLQQLDNIWVLQPVGKPVHNKRTTKNHTEDA